MIQITPQLELMLNIEPVDFRKGIDSLVGLCRSMPKNPYSGTVFAFRNKSGTSVKLLIYDGTGFWLCTKRFSRGKIAYWPSSSRDKICATTMMLILNQGEPANLAPSWRQLPASA